MKNFNMEAEKYFITLSPTDRSPGNLTPSFKKQHQQFYYQKSSGLLKARFYKRQKLSDKALLEKLTNYKLGDKLQDFYDKFQFFIRKPEINLSFCAKRNKIFW